MAGKTFPRRLVLLLILWAFTSNAGMAQILTILDSGRNCSLRGISVLNEDEFWVSGSNGTVAYSLSGGKTLQWLTVQGYEKRDFRDVQAFGNGSALIMAVDNPAIMLKTMDTGRTWQKVYEKDQAGMFLDAMNFDQTGHGYCIGDPVNGRFWILESFDKGNTWEEYPILFRPEAMAGEALFASSGSNLQFIKSGDYTWGFVTGGVKSRLFLMPDDALQPHKIINLGLNQGKQSTGANSWVVREKNWEITGGDFAAPALDSANACFSVDGGETFVTTSKSLGYKSCITTYKKGFISCGTSGVAFSQGPDGDWSAISRQPFHTDQATQNNNQVILAGPNGIVGKITNR